MVDCGLGVLLRSVDNGVRLQRNRWESDESIVQNGWSDTDDAAIAGDDPS